MPPSTTRPTVALVHGFPGGSTDFGLLADELIARGLGVATSYVGVHDLVGFGACPGRRPGIPLGGQIELWSVPATSAVVSTPRRPRPATRASIRTSVTSSGRPAHQRCASHAALAGRPGTTWSWWATTSEGRSPWPPRTAAGSRVR